MLIAAVGCALKLSQAYIFLHREMGKQFATGEAERRGKEKVERRVCSSNLLFLIFPLNSIGKVLNSI